jgi:hypothetical protein
LGECARKLAFSGRRRAAEIEIGGGSVRNALSCAENALGM